MSGKNLRKKSKTIKKRTENKNVQNNSKVKLKLPSDLREKIESENNPDGIVSEALSAYYSGKTRRNEAAVQKEIDNSIIEIQRRHISDLKDQLSVSNKNYEELMKTHQAYMLQVQPMIEAARLKEIEAKKEADEKQNESSTGNDTDKEEGNKTKLKSKRWYEFWK